jgi:acyl-homoserine-lactone acylase
MNKLMLKAAPVLLCVGFAAAAPGCATVPDEQVTTYVQRGERYDVEILRDPYGVPHLYGKRDVDCAYGLGFAHAEDDYVTIEKAMLLSRGQRARYFGADDAPLDYLVSLFRIREQVDAGYSSLDPKARAMAEAWADGVNHWAALHPDQVIGDDVLPITGQDVVAGFTMKTPFFFGMQNVLEDLFKDERQKTVADVAPVPSGIGSNGFAVAPGRSDDGVTRLIVNSHQPWEGEVAWYEIRLKSEEGLDVAGGTFPGAPMVLHGHNQKVGWALTVNWPDLIDVYVLETDPDDDNRYKYGDTWLELEEGTADINVKLLGPLRWTFGEDLFWSVHGPVLKRPHGVYAIRYAGAGDIRQIEQWWALNKMASLDDWRAVWRKQAIPSLNAVYADAEGHIGFFYNAKAPKRRTDVDWSGYLPGNDPSLVWTEHLTYDELPSVIDPPSGFVVSANHSAFRPTVGEGLPDPAGWDKSFGFDTQMTNRAHRALALLGDGQPISRERLLEVKFDKAYDRRSAVARTRAHLLASPVCEAPEMKQACESAEAWDLVLDNDRRGAAAVVLASREALLHEREIQKYGMPFPDPVPAFRDAVALLKRHYGRPDPTWGEVNRLRRGDLDLAVAGGPDTLRAVYGMKGLTDDGRSVGDTGDSFVMLVEWDADGKVSSASIHQYGTATSRPDSPHYDDQALMFVKETLKPVLLDEAELRAKASRVYRPGAAPLP